MRLNHLAILIVTFSIGRVCSRPFTDPRTKTFSPDQDAALLEDDLTRLKYSRLQFQEGLRLRGQELRKWYNKVLPEENKRRMTKEDYNLLNKMTEAELRGNVERWLQNVDALEALYESYEPRAKATTETVKDVVHF